MRTNNILSNESIHHCTGCQFCESICPTNAINFILDSDGFYKPQIDDNCINCGICKKNCYKFQEIKFDKNQDFKCYGAWSKNDDILNNSASGGIATELFKYYLYLGYKVVGVAYDTKKKCAKTIIVDDISNLNLLYGSKYMQTCNNKIYKKLINSDEKFVIIGTPCSIFPIYKWAKENKQIDRFIFIDFFCHGTPSNNLWKTYLNKYNSSDLMEVKFRSKVYGWHEFATEFRYKNKIYFSKKTHQDPFFELFFSNQLLNLSCYNCRCRDSFDYCDYRIGDFWGLKYQKNKKGVSALICVTSRSKKHFEHIKENLFYEQVEFNDITKAQAYKKIYTYNKNEREICMSQLIELNDIDAVLKNYISRKNITYKIFRNIKIIVSYFPRSFQNFLMYIYKKVGDD